MKPTQTIVSLLSGNTICAHALAPPHQCAQAPHQHILSKETPLCLNDEPQPSAAVYDHPIWSHSPFCVDKKGKEYCTHSTPKFRFDHGLSIISTPTAADAILSAFPFTRSARHISEEYLKVKAIQGKGYGLITSQYIPKYSTILLDAPRIIASAEFPAHVQHDQGSTLFAHALNQLPPRDRQTVLNLDKSLGGSDIEDIMKTNAFACQIHDGGADDAYMCLFPSVARINHACRPNAYARFVPKTLLMEVKALRDIAAGEEISISYGRIDLRYSERQKLYKQGWNFGCTCHVCTASEGAREKSDRDRARFAQLRKMLDSVTSETYNAQQIVKWEQEVMELSKLEGLDVLLAPDYERLSYVYAGHGMRRDARLWAEKARDSLMEWNVVDGGPRLDLERVVELLDGLGGEV